MPTPPHGPGLTADYFVDPICSWSWGNEPRIRRFVTQYGHAVRVRRRTGGLMEKRDAGFFDPQYGLSGADAAAIAEHQAEVAAETGMPIDVGVWEVFPPASSHPACIAVHAAAFQGPEVGDACFRRIQEGFFTARRAVDRPESLLALMTGLPGLDLHRFARDLVGPAAYAAFREDWEAARNPVPEARDVKETEGRLRYAFPTLVLENADGLRRVLDGGSTDGDYTAAVAALAPEVTPAPLPEPAEALRRWGTAATREVALVCGLSDAEAEARLEGLEATGNAEDRRVGFTRLWTWTGG